MSVLLRRAAIALSLANLCYLKVWSELLSTEVTKAYLAKLPIAPQVYLMVSGCVVLNAALMVLGVWLLTRVRGGRFLFIADLLFLAAFAVVLNSFRVLVANHFHVLGGTAIAGQPLLIAGILLCSAGAVYWRKKVVPVVAALVMILAPFAAVTFGWAIVRTATYESGSSSGGGATRKPAKPRQRFVWIVFDELDQHLSFERRPAGLEMPEFDRLAESALTAINAYPPDKWTLEAMPSLIQGREIDSVKIISAESLQLKVSGSEEPILWKAAGSIFEKAQELDLNTSLVGWYHPYCRIFDSELTQCWWHEYPTLTGALTGSPTAIFLRLNKIPFESLLYSPFGQSVFAEGHARNIRSAIDKAVEYAADPDLGFTLIHLGLPHSPHVYDRSRKDFSLANAPIAGYVDSLALADVVLGRIRASMESAHLWDSSTVLVSSDHFFRESANLTGRQEYRVPFLLKLPGQTAGGVYEPAFSTTASHDLLVELMRGSLIPEPAAVVSWLDAHRLDSKIPPEYLKNPLARRAAQ